MSLLYPLSHPFNPHEHEAIALIANLAIPPGSIADVLQLGARLDDALMRPGRVTVVAADSVAPSS